MSDAGRWGDAWFVARRFPEQCRYCGQGGPDGDHRPTTCRACEMPVCLNGTSSECPICLVGILNGYAALGERDICGYASCKRQAVARGGRVGRVCDRHIGRASLRYGLRALTFPELIAERATNVRETGYPNPKGLSRAHFTWTPGHSPEGAT